MSPPKGNTEKPNTIEMPTSKAVIAMVRMIQSEDEELKPIALELAGFIVEAYDDKQMLLDDILGSFVRTRASTPLAAKKLMERQFPNELNILQGIFGEFLFGGS